MDIVKKRFYTSPRMLTLVSTHRRVWAQSTDSILAGISGIGLRTNLVCAIYERHMDIKGYPVVQRRGLR